MSNRSWTEWRLKMPTNDERRDVARKLREAYAKMMSPGLFEPQGMSIQAMNYLRDIERCVPDGDSLMLVLADLIDPDNIPDNPDETGRPLSEPEIDREWLLAIATVMAADSARSVKEGNDISPVYILHAARNIAEACGETLGSIRNRELAEWGTSIVPKETIVDRDALLALAEEMEEFGNLPVKHPGVRVLHNDDFSRELGYARRIREALGVEQ